MGPEITWWDGPNAVPEKYIQSVDDNVMIELPIGTRILSISSHAASYWTRTAKIEAEDPDGSPTTYFLKVTISDNGRAMLAGESISMSTIDNLVPPMPIAYGSYAADPSIHFFLCSFAQNPTAMGPVTDCALGYNNWVKKNLEWTQEKKAEKKKPKLACNLDWITAAYATLGSPVQDFILGSPIEI